MIVNDNVDIAPLIIGFVRNDFEKVGAGAGTRQPLNVTLSMANRELLFWAPVAEIRKKVEPALALKVELASVAPNVADPPAGKVTPSVLEENVTVAPAFQLALVCT